MKVKLCSGYGPLPKWWGNFLDEIGINVARTSGGRYTVTYNVGLAPYGGRHSVTYDEHGFVAERWLEFERECDYTWFILRFS